MPAFTVDRLTVEDGTVIMSNTRDRYEMRIDRIAATGSLDAADARLDVRANVGDQPVHLQANAKTPFAGLDGANVPVEVSFEAPGVLDDKVTGTADVRTGASVFRINGLAGKIGTSRLNGWASVEFSGKPVVKADFDVERLALRGLAVVAGRDRPAAASEREILAGERVVERAGVPADRAQLCRCRRFSSPRPN